MLNLRSTKAFTPSDLKKASGEFSERRVTPTGRMCGRGARRSASLAGIVEARFDDAAVHLKAQRRAAWVFPEALSGRYDPRSKTMWLEFTLPPSSYATVLIEALQGQELTV
jgi:tRNA pseudouridine13 synthase